MFTVHTDLCSSSRTRIWPRPSAPPASRRSSCSTTSSSDHRCHSHTRFTGGKKQSTYAGSTSTRPRRPCRSSMVASRIGRNETVMGRTRRWLWSISTSRVPCCGLLKERRDVFLLCLEVTPYWGVSTMAGTMEDLIWKLVGIPCKHLAFRVVVLPGSNQSSPSYFFRHPDR